MSSKPGRSAFAPLVSIVVPVYNHASYLGRTIESVLAQDYSKLECIVVDDGSTDDSAEVAAAFGDRIRLLRQPNRGQAAALNVGWAASGGELLGYLSSDDLLDPGLVSAAVAAASRLSEPRVVFPRYRFVGPGGETLKAVAPPFRGVVHMLESFQCRIGPGALFDRSLLRSLGGWDGSYRQIPDMEFWMRAAQTAAFLQFDGPRASFRVHSTSQTHMRATAERADEAIRAVRDPRAFQPVLGEAGCRRMRASAHVFSAALHLKARRIAAARARFIAAVKYSPIVSLRARSLLRLAGAAYSNIRYRV